MAGVILHPLAEVGIGVLMPVVVRCRQLVMNLQRCGKRRDREQDAGEEKRDDGAGSVADTMAIHDHPGRQIRKA